MREKRSIEKEKNARQPIKAYLGLGSNLDNPILQIKTAIEALAMLPSTILITASQLYRNPPVGILDQPDFINAVAAIETTLSASVLFDLLLAIENQQQRVRVIKNGPRTLDVDLLLYGNTISDDQRLTLPHPRLKERSFVVLPLSEIAPRLVLPCGTSINELLTQFDKNSLESV